MENKVQTTDLFDIQAFPTSFIDASQTESQHLHQQLVHHSSTRILRFGTGHFQQQIDRFRRHLQESISFVHIANTMTRLGRVAVRHWSKANGFALAV
jgi:hypothetical protein